MTDAMLQNFAIGVVATLLAFELTVALASWFQATSAAAKPGQAPLRLTRSFAIRGHIESRRQLMQAARARWQALRVPAHGRRVRAVIRGLQPVRLAALAGCTDCRGSRMRGLPRCSTCLRRLAQPGHAIA